MVMSNVNKKINRNKEKIYFKYMDDLAVLIVNSEVSFHTIEFLNLLGREYGDNVTFDEINRKLDYWISENDLNILVDLNFINTYKVDTEVYIEVADPIAFMYR